MFVSKNICTVIHTHTTIPTTGVQFTYRLTNTSYWINVWTGELCDSHVITGHAPCNTAAITCNVNTGESMSVELRMHLLACIVRTCIHNIIPCLILQHQDQVPL